jgi:DNA-binding response OmpR family regulator
MSTDTCSEHILVVDDRPENLRFLAEALSGAGYRPRPVKSGRLAIEGARRDPPNLILLDINMPGMNGYAVCDAMKSDELLADIPVIFVSALDDTFDKVKAFEHGGVDYVTKPFQVEEVLARVETHLVLRRLQVEQERTIEKLNDALDEIKTLRSFIPICAHCKEIRNDEGYWQSVEQYMNEHAGMTFSHSICPNCLKKHYPEYEENGA